MPLEQAKAQNFAILMNPLKGFNNYWLGASEPKVQVNDLFNPDSFEKTVYAPAEKASGWKRAIAASFEAIRAANPFNGVSPVAEAVGQETQKVGSASTNLLVRAAGAVHQAGEGIFSGFRWASVIVIGAILIYVFLLVAPFLPKPSWGNK